jgi:hypothetical protein
VAESVSSEVIAGVVLARLCRKSRATVVVAVLPSARSKSPIQSSTSRQDILFIPTKGDTSMEGSEAAQAVPDSTQPSRLPLFPEIRRFWTRLACGFEGHSLLFQALTAGFFVNFVTAAILAEFFTRNGRLTFSFSWSGPFFFEVAPWSALVLAVLSIGLFFSFYSDPELFPRLSTRKRLMAILGLTLVLWVLQSVFWPFVITLFGGLHFAFH